MENPLLKYLALVKTVETGSFTRAAQALNYAQSSVSKMVADLKAKWGMTLLERSKRGICLTSAGEQVLPFLRKVLNDHAELEGQICRMNGIETGVVRIGTFASVAIHWLPNIFSALQRDYPGIGYEMLLGDYDEVERWIGEGRVDCGFLRLPTLPGFDTMLLKQDEYKVVLPVGHPLAARESVPIEALNGLPFCCWSTAERPRSPTCSSARTCSQTSGLRRGRILRSWLWQNAGSASGSCRI